MKLILLSIFFISSLSQAQWTNSGSNTYLTNSGNSVGIGLTTPAAKLHIYSTIQNPRMAIQTTSATGSPGFSLGNSSTPEMWVMHYNIADSYFGIFKSGLGNTFAIASTGKVGIGTNTPQTSLDVKGDLRLGSISEQPAEGGILEGVFGNYIIGDNSVAQRLKLGVSNDGYTKAEIFIDNSNRPDGTIAFKTSTGAVGSATRMFINGNGNVSINTTDSKGYRFAVNGDAMFTKIKVKSFAQWPDYVFKTDYDLLPITDLAEFIKLNNHLPNVPSSDEIETEGIDVAATQAILLEKIEELTLYLIEQNKLLLEQKTEIEKLKRNQYRRN